MASLLGQLQRRAVTGVHQAATAIGTVTAISPQYESTQIESHPGNTISGAGPAALTVVQLRREPSTCRSGRIGEVQDGTPKAYVVAVFIVEV